MTSVYGEPGHKSALHHAFSDLIMAWARDDSAPEHPMEGITPALAATLSSTPIDHTFDAFLHPNEVSGWVWQQVVFAESFETPFALYLPGAWSDFRIMDPVAIVADAEQRVRQSVGLLPRSEWLENLPEFLERSTVEGFAYYPLLPGYVNWTFMVRGADGAFWVWTACGGGDWVLLIKGDAADATELRTQLTAVVNANPWAQWIRAAREQMK